MNNIWGIAALVFGVIVAFVAAQSFYTVDETERVIITQFGRPLDDVIDQAGLKAKIPFIQEVNRIEKSILVWDGSAND
ncbi:MAG: hypothetical protein RIE74_13105, partial [Pseudomonadales bacterium]